VNWILDCDIRGFFDNLSHEWLLKFVQHRVADHRILRLIQKWLKAGVLEEGEWKDTQEGIQRAVQQGCRREDNELALREDFRRSRFRKHA